MLHRPALLRALAPCLLALAACGPTVVGNGVFAEETRDVAAFSGISVQDGVLVEASAAASSQLVELSGDENVLEHVITEVTNEAGFGPTLVVRTDVERIESTHPLRVTVAATALDHVRAADGAVVGVTAVAAESLDVRARDGAVVTLSGAGGEALNLVLADGVALDARSYVTNVATVDLSGGVVAAVHVDAGSLDLGARRD
jgi:hypothetical protein